MIPLGPLAPYAALLKVAALAIVAAAIFGAGWKAGAGLTEARWQRERAKQAAEYQSALTRAREAERAAYAKSQEVSRGLQNDLAAIRAERDRLRDRPARVVRLCPDTDPAAGRMPAAPGAAGRRDAAAPAAAENAGAPGRDIGGPLYELVDDGDEREAELARRLVACQDAAAGR